MRTGDESSPSRKVLRMLPSVTHETDPTSRPMGRRGLMAPPLHTLTPRPLPAHAVPYIEISYFSFEK